LPPPPSPAYVAPDDALLPGGSTRVLPREAQTPPVPDTWLPHIEPVITAAPAHGRIGPGGRALAAAALAVVIVIAGVISVLHAGHHAAPPPPPPEILAPQSPSVGIPTSLSAVVRIAAESSRHTALSTVISMAGITGDPVSITQLQSEQPEYQWVLGDQPSTTNAIISITSAPGIDVIAVSGTNRDICAFGRWSPTTGSEYATMAHVKTCNASSAPQNGWSTIAGGSAQDLPDPSP
jgi:hypothetical protein